MGHHHFFSTHVVQAVPLHFGDGPLDGAFQGFRTAETVADMIGEICQSSVGPITGQRGPDDSG